MVSGPEREIRLPLAAQFFGQIPSSTYLYLLRMLELFLQLPDTGFMLLLGPSSAMFTLVPLGDPVADCKRRGFGSYRFFTKDASKGERENPCALAVG